MDRIEAALDGLVEAIADSPQYRRYLEVSEKVHGYPQLERQINEFRKKNFELQSSTGQGDLFDRVDQFETEYAQFRKDPLVQEYLSAELAVCRVLQNVNYTILRNIDFDAGLV